MDVVAAAFASVLELVSAGVSDHLRDVQGVELKVVTVEHAGVQVPFAYQLWRIRPQSVCHSYKQNIGDYSRCTVAAKSLFMDVCSQMQAQGGGDFRAHKLKNMYCTASVSYQPTIATISAASEQSPLEQARAACNLAIAEGYGNDDPAVRKKKDTVCAEYKAMKSKLDE